MSRMSGGETIVVPARSNVYTVLVAVAMVVEIVGLVLLFMRAEKLIPPGLLQ